MTWIRTNMLIRNFKPLSFAKWISNPNTESTEREWTMVVIIDLHTIICQVEMDPFSSFLQQGHLSESGPHSHRSSSFWVEQQRATPTAGDPSSFWPLHFQPHGPKIKSPAPKRNKTKSADFFEVISLLSRAKTYRVIFNCDPAGLVNVISHLVLFIHLILPSLCDWRTTDSLKADFIPSRITHIHHCKPLASRGSLWVYEIVIRRIAGILCKKLSRVVDRTNPPNPD